MKHRVIIEFEDQKAWDIWTDKRLDIIIRARIKELTKCRPGGTVRVEHEETKGAI